MESPTPASPTLEGRYVRLVPLTQDHVAPLCDVGFDPEIWRWGLSTIATPDDMQRYVTQALAERDAGTALPFAQIEVATVRTVGSTRLANIDRTHRRAEIGWTWLGRPWQRSAINTEAKLLLFTYAFDVMGCRRVELKTDVLNEQSRRAIKRLGAVEEGIFRRHMIAAAGRSRDTVYFSVIDDEWPSVRRGLEERLGVRS